MKKRYYIVPILGEEYEVSRTHYYIEKSIWMSIPICGVIAIITILAIFIASIS